MTEKTIRIESEEIRDILQLEETPQIEVEVRYSLGNIVVYDTPFGSHNVGGITFLKVIEARILPSYSDVTKLVRKYDLDQIRDKLYTGGI